MACEKSAKHYLVIFQTVHQNVYMRSLTRAYNFIASTKQNDVLLKLLVFICCIFVYLFITRRKLFPGNVASEGFEQQDKFVLKRNIDSYDPFYIQVYDQLYQTNRRIPHEIKAFESTQPDKINSVILDIGCGTGCLVEQLQNQGYERVFGIDKSKDMVKVAREKYPSAKTKLGDVMNPMEFEYGTFSHLLCTNMTVYSFADKHQFFKNCASWLLPHGYLVVHLVDPDKFDPITPAGKPAMFASPQTYAGKERITQTLIDFDKFTYKSAYDFGQCKDKGIVVHTETFTDASSRHVRQNEHELFMTDVATTLKYAAVCGFSPIAQFTLTDFTRDPHQYLFVLEKVGR